MDLYVSPCRGCDEDKIDCRQTCGKLSAYRELAQDAIMTRSYTEQYQRADELFGRRRYEKAPERKRGGKQ